MMDALYTGLAGMQAYSQGLDVISNNVANLKTNGFKTSTPNFQDLVFQNTSGALDGEPADPQSGAGVKVSNTTESFAQGQFSTTNNPLDAAIDGSGFFVLRSNGSDLYTRAGQFKVDKDGFIVDSASGAQIMFSSASSPTGPLNVNASQADAPKVTTSVTLSGNLARNATTTSSSGTTTPVTTYDTPAITVFDSSGGSQTVTVHFVQDTANPLAWTAEVHDASGAAIGTANLTFNADGTLAADATVVATITPKSAPQLTVTFNLGTANTFSGVTDIATGSTSSVQAAKVDGQALGTLTQYAFTDKGELQATYSNGNTQTLGTLVLAHFQTQDQLQEIGSGAFAAVSQPSLGAPLQNGLGRVVGGKVEMSNVDLTGQFTDLIIIQRGYQAGSQMVSTANEMMQQLLDMSRGR